MAKWNIQSLEYAAAVLQDEAGVVSRREGEVSVRTTEAFGEAPSSLIVSGRLYFGEKRVYGRFTRVQKGKLSFPVCLELFDTYNKRGVQMEPGSTAETARFGSSVLVKAVDSFE